MTKETKVDEKTEQKTDLVEKPAGAAAAAEFVRDVGMIDPGVSAYSFAGLADAVKFSDLMARAGVMIPAHCREKPAVCLAITMRATQWGMDPFALAYETYQAKDDGPVGYMAKVFVTALRQMTGLRLQYRYSGNIERTGKPVNSAKGSPIAPNGYRGDMVCTAFAVVDGVELTYDTPPYDEINPKNSPLWHNDARQQLAYYAGRGWVRRHEPGVMMGCFSNDEVEEMAMRDVTPAAPKKSGFAAMIERKRAEAEAEDAETRQEDAAAAMNGNPEPVEETAEPVEETAEPVEETAAAVEETGQHWTDEIDPDDGTPGTDHFEAGAKAFDDGLSDTDCPETLRDDYNAAADWLRGWNGARRARE